MRLPYLLLSLSRLLRLLRLLRLPTVLKSRPELGLLMTNDDHDHHQYYGTIERLNEQKDGRTNEQTNVSVVDENE